MVNMKYFAIFEALIYFLPCTILIQYLPSQEISRDPYLDLLQVKLLLQTVNAHRL